MSKIPPVFVLFNEIKRQVGHVRYWQDSLAKADEADHKLRDLCKASAKHAAYCARTLTELIPQIGGSSDARAFIASELRQLLEPIKNQLDLRTREIDGLIEDVTKKVD